MTREEAEQAYETVVAAVEQAAVLAASGIATEQTVEILFRGCLGYVELARLPACREIIVQRLQARPLAEVTRTPAPAAVQLFGNKPTTGES